MPASPSSRSGKSFGEKPILHGSILEIADGSFTVLCRAVGLWQPTLLRMIAGPREITSGEIRDWRAAGVNELPPG